MTPARDIALDLPLAGVRRIEASAGTGKTFTLALLHTRLVVERALPVRRILAVTFTNAATQELRERLRTQLARAAAIAALAPTDRAALCASADAAERLTALAIVSRGEIEPPEALAERLRRAAGDIDLAAIFTIHGFCQRVLADHAVQTGEPLLPRERLAGERALYEEVAADIWRRWTRSDEDARDLGALFASPEALARELPALVQADRLLPEAAPLDAEADADFARAAAALRAAWTEGGGDARAALEHALAAKVLHSGRLRADTLAALFNALTEFCIDAASEAPADERLAYLTPGGLRERANAGRAEQVPASPLFDAIERFLDARAGAEAARAQRRANLLHALRTYARERAATLKRQRNLVAFDDLITGVHDALCGAGGDALARSLRAEYPVALVDEFQDTDPRQWRIFERIYVDAPLLPEPVALFLIGDPKQAIYRFRGGDVHTYHAAAARADSEHALGANFRSRPRLLAAVATMFAQGGEFPFADALTRFPPIAPGGNVDDDAFARAGAAAAGLHLWRLPLREGEVTRPTRAVGQPRIRREAARALAATLAATGIRDLLADESAILYERGRARRVRPGDIAVLVNTHREAEITQAALAEFDIASVTAGRSSLYASAEAEEIRRVLEAAAAPADEGALRAAMASVLLGADAATIDALSRDEAAHRAWLDAFQAWRERWQRLGPLAMLADRIAAAAPRLLALADGERRLSNYLQLAEHLQEARTGAFSMGGLIDWLAQRIASADDRDETQQLRLAGDAARVQILTLHKAKGLEFPLVFLPFAALAPGSPPTQSLGLLQYHDGAERVLRARIDGVDDAGYERARAIAERETRAEQLRLLYVALTRARHAVWLAHGAVNDVERTALGWLLHRRDDAVAAIGDDDVAAALAALATQAPAAIVCETPPVPSGARLASDDLAAAKPPLRIARRVLRQDWWMYSFSQLAREDAQIGALVEAPGAEDETRTGSDSVSPFTGARFGNALHAALEQADFAAWGSTPTGAIPPGERENLRHALAAQGYAGEEIVTGSEALAALVGATLRAPLPEGVRLADLPLAARRSEFEFHFAIGDLAVPRLLERLHRDGLLPARTSFGLRDRLQGLMTGFIDLVYAHAGRVYLLDYKSNRLPGYAQADLERAMQASEYELQYLIYALALHRWLRFRHADYDYERDFGGVRYLFCRGLGEDGDDARGIFATRPPRALIEDLDALFAPAEVRA